MDTGKELNYRLYIQRMNGFTRLPFASEMSKYMDIRDGDVESVKKRHSPECERISVRARASFPMIL